jgi:hypothetical protein
MGRDAGFVAPTTPHRDAGIGFEGSRELPDKRDMHKAKSKGRHRPGGQSGAGSARSAGGDPIAGTDATGPAAYGGGPAAGAMPGKKNDGRR